MYSDRQGLFVPAHVVSEAVSLPCDSDLGLVPIVDQQGDIALFCGNKQLGLEIPPSEFSFFGTLIATTYGDSVSGSTTALYEHARELMGFFATRIEAPVNYAFSTRNEAMANWAREHGARIFDWVIDTDNPTQFRATTIIPADSNN